MIKYILDNGSEVTVIDGNLSIEEIETIIENYEYEQSFPHDYEEISQNVMLAEAEAEDEYDEDEDDEDILIF